MFTVLQVSGMFVIEMDVRLMIRVISEVVTVVLL